MGSVIIPPVYSQIALDIALRITRGELKENTRISGRSVLSSEYGVSPETIRRAMKLLEDMEIVEVRQNSGIRIASAENARQYVERFGAQNDIRTYRSKINALLAEQEAIGREIAEVAGSIVRISQKFSRTSPFVNYEVDIPSSFSMLGKTLGELKFWQQTGATVIAIRRGDKIILSPGPYAALLEGDTIIFVGDTKSVEAVNAFIGHDG